MHPDLIDRLRCPVTGERLLLEHGPVENGRIETGSLVSERSAHRYAIRGYIPRFAAESNYADSFGIQWNRFRRTQLDSYSGHPISATRFWKATGWEPQALAGQWMLDVGCGAGRFAEVALNAGAYVVALDYSNAVDACYANLSHYPNLHVVQGNVYALPFAKQSFSYVYSLGVLQHTPHVARAFLALPRVLKTGGQLCVDFYEKSWKAIGPKYLLRPITRRMTKAKLFAALQIMVPKMLPLSCVMSRVPVIGPFLKHLVPVANYIDVLPLTQAQHLEWALLDTFDWLAPEYDNPQAASTVARWFKDAHFEDFEIVRAGHLVGRGTAPHAAGH
jgi:ubiquinone/menaquinone biosynthesis C-methylase UbiE/uncharacterized protein YbaR (Trm112 family)